MDIVNLGYNKATVTQEINANSVQVDTLQIIRSIEKERYHCTHKLTK